MSPTFDPQTSLFYVNAREQCDMFSTAPQPYEAGHAYYGSAYFPADQTEPFWGALRAIDPSTGQVKWEFRHPSPSWSGVLSTAGGLFSPVTQKEISSRWTPLAVSPTGTFRPAERCTLLQWPSPLTEKSTWQLRREVRCTLLVCPSVV